ncbi:hypothetical protein SAMN04487957_101348 [Halomonas shengliensis]|uniref:Uncharacterized protein n=1 Tax=Halomonas shengliensis TaxID=419597 RepID=A0A1H0DBS8_9GAMM|nr:hypothetical protein SAMN04487957_101348 [Halomonas shengliensis]
MAPRASGSAGHRAFRRSPPWGVLGIVFVAMALKADALLASPGLLLEIAVPLLLLYAINLLLSTLMARA